MAAIFDIGNSSGSNSSWLLKLHDFEQEKETEAAFKQITGEPKTKQVKTFYCPGGLNYNKMGVMSKLMMRTLLKALQAKKNKTQEDEEMIKMISSSYDISDQKYIEPILACLLSSL